MKDLRCPYCRAPFTPFNLREDNALTQTVFSRVAIEQGLPSFGLRCTENAAHEFCCKAGRLVEISAKLSKEHAPPPNPTLAERANNWLAEFALEWFHWAPLPEDFWVWVRDQLLYPWQVAELWYVVYDPNAYQLYPEDEARILDDMKADWYGEGDEPEEPRDDFVFPYADMDDGWSEADDREEGRQDELYAEDNDPDAWAEHAADEADRDHGTDFSDDEDSEEAWPWDEGLDEQDWVDDEPKKPDSEPSHDKK